MPENELIIGFYALFLGELLEIFNKNGGQFTYLLNFIASYNLKRHLRCRGRLKQI